MPPVDGIIPIIIDLIPETAIEDLNLTSILSQITLEENGGISCTAYVKLELVSFAEENGDPWLDPGRQFNLSGSEILVDKTYEFSEKHLTLKAVTVSNITGNVEAEFSFLGVLVSNLSPPPVIVESHSVLNFEPEFSSSLPESLIWVDNSNQSAVTYCLPELEDRDGDTPTISAVKLEGAASALATYDEVTACFLFDPSGLSVARSIGTYSIRVTVVDDNPQG